MSNHYHIVVKVNPEEIKNCSDRQVADRWLELFQGPDIVQRWVTGDELDDYQLPIIGKFISTWRERLSDLSWLMRCLNESIARMANREDRCTGKKT